MNTVETQATVAVLAAYIQGRKDGFAAGVTFSAAVIVFWKAYKRGRDDTGHYRIFGTTKK
jgi:hypothetical protein